MQKQKSKNSKVFLIIATVLALIAIIGFFYPFLTKSPTYTPQQDVGTQNQDTSAHLPTVEAPVTGVPLVNKITDLFKPGLSVYYGISTSDLIDSSKFSEDEKLYSAIRKIGQKSSESSRVTGTKNFTAPGIGYYVYFAWPTAYENEGKFSCKSITLYGDAKGTVDCFSSGTSDAVLFNTTDMVHRSLPSFVGDDGDQMSYELYRAHFYISSGGTVYYSPR